MIFFGFHDILSLKWWAFNS